MAQIFQDPTLLAQIYKKSTKKWLIGTIVGTLCRKSGQFSAICDTGTKTGKPYPLWHIFGAQNPTFLSLAGTLLENPTILSKLVFDYVEIRLTRRNDVEINLIVC